AETAALMRRLWRGYDLAVSTQAGDRPTFFGLIAARRRVGLVPRAGQTGAWWKRHAHHIPVAAEPDCHRVTQLLGLASALGLEQAPDIVWPQGGTAGEVTPIPPRTPSDIPARSIATSVGPTRAGALGRGAFPSADLRWWRLKAATRPSRLISTACGDLPIPA